MLIASKFAPSGWAFCDGSTLNIRENTALFALLSTTYGGDGRITFGLPDLRGRVPLGAGAGPGLTPRSLGSSGGAEGVALTVDQLPTHPNQPAASAGLGTTAAPAAAYPANGGAGAALYAAAATPQATQPSAPLGGGQAHNNLQPYLALNYVIALYGIFPRRPY
jgi:microcystin-dependent protein